MEPLSQTTVETISPLPVEYSDASPAMERFNEIQQWVRERLRSTKTPQVIQLRSEIPYNETGKLLPQDARARYTALQWLMWQMGGFGPMAGQAHHFRRFAKEQIPYAIDRYTNETRRLYGVLDKRLGEADYVAGDYSIADIAIFPWAARHEWQGVALEEFPAVKRWYDAIAARPAVEKGMAVPS